MRKIIENSISLVVALISLAICCNWYAQGGGTEPLLGIVASGGVLLAGVVSRFFREEKEIAPFIAASKQPGVEEKGDIKAGGDGTVVVGNPNSVVLQTIITYPDGHKIPRLLTPPPFIPPIFLGRDEELQEVHDRLFSGQHLLLLVHGQGGMGKTSFAAGYWQQYEKEYCHLAFLYVGNGIADALLTLAGELGVVFPDAMPGEVRLEKLIGHLTNLQQPCLLILDNANDEADLDKNYALLRHCAGLHLLLTSRLTEFQETESYAIGALKDDVPLQLFKKHYPRHTTAEDELFWGIFHTVGGNTLVLEILAKNLHEINQNETFYPLSQLLADLQQKGLLRLSEQAKVKVHWQNAAKAEPEEIIQAIYELHPLAAEDLALLSNFAVLPPENIPYAMLKDLLQPENAREFSERLTRLARKGWIEKSETEGASQYKVSPVVQEIVRLKNERLREDCGPLIDAIIKKLDYEPGVGHLLNATYEDALIFTRYASFVIGAFSMPDQGLSILCERIGNYHQTTSNLEGAFFFFEKYNRIAKALCEADPENADFKNELAISYQKQGGTHSSLGNRDTALVYFEQFSELEKGLYAAYPQNVGFKNSLAISY